MKRVVLLGAGASADAGVPVSTGLTEAIVDHIENLPSERLPLTHAINFAVASLLAHDTARGVGGAYDGIDVERLFAAVQMLKERDELEIAPFVANWSPTLDGLGQPSRRLPMSWKKEFERALTKTNQHDLERTLVKLFDTFEGRVESTQVFTVLERTMIDALVSLVDVKPNKVDYLAPVLAGDGPIQIATLNYDRSVELVASRAGLSVDTGIKRWKGGHDWQWDPKADVRLLKLHGSVDWRSEPHAVEAKLADTRIVTRQVKGRSRPAVVFGQRGKVRADGPFLAMLRAFDEMLSTADELVIVGYSLRDDHINTAIRRWFNGRPKPRVTIVDRAKRPIGSRRKVEQSFAVQLDRVMRQHIQKDGKPVFALRPGMARIQENAAAGLLKVFGPGPDLSIAPNADDAYDDAPDDES